MTITRSKFAKLYSKIWSDAKILDMDLFAERFFQYSFSNDRIEKNISGIYEISIRTFTDTSSGFIEDRIAMLSQYDGISVNKSKLNIKAISRSILEEFNNKKNTMLKYNFDEQIIYVKSYFKYYMRTPGNPHILTKMLINEFNDTYHKVPDFWKELGKSNTRRLQELRERNEDLIKNGHKKLKEEMEKTGKDRDKEKIEKLKKEHENYAKTLSKFDTVFSKIIA